MILKLLVLVTTTHIIRSERLLIKSTSKPNPSRDIQELLDSLYMTGSIPEYILPEDELTETEKTEGEYLDFPELKNAQDDVFVPPESEYSKNNFHYKNIKARKRLIPNRHEKIKLLGLQQEITQPEISPEELRSDLMAHLVENLVGCEQKKNDSIKLDFLIPIPERGMYPSNDSPNEGSSSTQCYSLARHYDPNEFYNPIEQSGIRRSKHTTSSSPFQNGRPTPNENNNTETTTCYQLITYENCNTTALDNSRQSELNNTKPTKDYNSPTDDICASILPDNSKPTEYYNTKPTKDYNSPTDDICASTLPDNSKPTEYYNTKPTKDYNSPTDDIWASTLPGSSKTNELFNTEPTKDNNSATCDLSALTVTGNSRTTELFNPGPNKGYSLTPDDIYYSATDDICISTNMTCDTGPTDPCNTVPIEPMNNLRITQQGETKNLNQQGQMKSLDQQRMKILNPQWPLNTPNPQLLHEIPSPQGPMKTLNQQGPMNTPNPKGLINTFNPQGLMKIFIPPLNNILNPPQWFMNLSTNRRNFSKEPTQSSISNQYSLTIPEQANIPKYTGLKKNTTIQPLTFEIVGPKSEQSIKRLQFTETLQSQPNVTIKPALEIQIKNMFNIKKQSSPHLIVNKKQQENSLRTPALVIRKKKRPGSSTIVPSTKRMTRAQEDQTINAKLDNSSIRVDLKTVDKNIATNVVSLSADPSNVNKMEAEVFKTGIKSSDSVNNEMTRNIQTYFDKQSNNSLENMKLSSQNTRNKEQKFINQHFISPSTEKENADGGKPKKNMFTFLNIFKKNKKYPPSNTNTTGQNSTTQVKREITENSNNNELYRLLMEGDTMNEDDYNYEYPIEQEVEEQEMFNHKRKKK